MPPKGSKAAFEVADSEEEASSTTQLEKALEALTKAMAVQQEQNLKILGMLEAQQAASASANNLPVDHAVGPTTAQGPVAVPPPAVAVSPPVVAIPPPAFAAPLPVTANRLITEFNKLRPPHLKGTEDYKSLHDWINAMEMNFESFPCREEEKVTLAAHQLEEDALTWWLREKEGIPTGTLAWGQFREKLMDNFLPPSARRALFKEFLHFKQGQRSVAEYDREYRRLERYGRELVPTEKLRIEKFEDGLRYNLRDLVQPYRSKTYAGLVDVALKVEANDKQKAGTADRLKRKMSTTSEAKGKRLATMAAGKAQPTTQDKYACYKCGLRGHKAQECKGTVQCRKCGERGHIAKICKGEKQPLAVQPLAALPAPPVVDKGKQPMVAQGQLFALTNEDAANSSGVITGKQPMISIC